MSSVNWKLGISVNNNGICWPGPSERLILTLLAEANKHGFMTLASLPVGFPIKAEMGLRI